MLVKLKSQVIGCKKRQFLDFYLQTKGDENEDNLIAENTSIKLYMFIHKPLVIFVGNQSGNILGQSNIASHTVIPEMADETPY